MTQYYERALKPIITLVELAIVVLGITMVALVFVQVILRYTATWSFFGSEELTRFLFSWFIFLSATAALGRGMHFAVDPIGHFLPGAAVKALKFVVMLIILAILCVLVSRGWAMTWRNWRQLSSALQVPLSFANAAIPVSAMLMILITIRDILRVVQPSEAPPQV